MLMYFIHKGAWLHFLPKIYHKLSCAVFQITISTKGQPIRDRQVLFISNHISYLDIPALSTVLPRIHFVAKRDVQDWPVWGFLAKLQQTVFISRNRHDAHKESAGLESVIASGKNLTIFAEGTSTDGGSVEPFKSSLFSVVQGPHAKELTIQPITIRITGLDGKPHTGADRRNLYAWPRELDMDLMPHLWRFAKSKGVELQVVFHDPIRADAFSDRKTLAKACYDAVCNGLKS